MNLHQDNPACLAQGMMKCATKRLLTKYPFYGHIVGKWQVQASAETETMGVTIRDAQLTLLYSPPFVVELKPDQLVGVLQHEAHHVLFGHLLVDRSILDDLDARVIAEEVTVNEFITEPLPSGAITLDLYPELPADEDTDTRYRRLCNSGGRDPDQHSGGPKPNADVPKTHSDVPKTGVVAPKTASVAPDRRTPGPRNCTPIRPMDDHDLWHGAAQSILGPMVVRQNVEQARRELSEQQWRELPAAIHRQVQRVCGDQPGQWREKLDNRTTVPAKNWRMLLERYVERSVAVVPTFSRPPRRLPHLLGIIPGNVLRPQKARVLAAIDTSGSMTSEDLAMICSELTHLGRVHEVFVLEGDSCVHALYRYHGEPIQSVHGRGGTDLGLAFQPQILQRIRPDVVLYFTDGHGPAPDTKPAVPVVWCLTHDGVRPAPWGRDLRLPANDQHPRRQSNQRASRPGSKR